MKKLLTLIATMIICNVYGAETVAWLGGTNPSGTVCNAGGNITKPSSDPTKSGYRFIGWQNVTNQYNFTNFNQNIGGTAYYDVADNSTANEKVWGITYSYGTIFGTWLCSTSNGTVGDTLANPSTTLGYVCWCKALAYQDTSGKYYVPSNSLQWVLTTNSYTTKTVEMCLRACLHSCVVQTEHATATASKTIRQRMYGK